MSTADSFLPIFDKSIGYALVVGVGAAFAIFMVATSWLLSKVMNEVQDSEMLMTAKRSVKTGLIASAVVSSWTIGSTLLLSCTSAYSWGVSGPWWYGGGACVQIIIFCTFAIELKRKAPNCHTFQEVVRYRYGTATHITMCLYSLIQQITYASNLLINGSSIYSNFTGVNRDLCIFLFPIGVTIYTLFGGIKATFITDYIHTVIIYVLMMMFVFVTYTTSDQIGSPGKLYDLLVTAAENRPIEGNLMGSFMTFTSVQGGLFGLVLFGAGWAAAVDSQLFQKAISANPGSALMGYIIGGLSWFTIPFCLATTLGLACAGLEFTESFPGYPNRLSADDVGAGLVMPIAAYILMGKGGAIGVLLMVFMAVTSAFSSETVAVSSLVVHDFYKAYINPNATGKQLVLVSHLGTLTFCVICIGLSIGLSHAGFAVSFITSCSGIVVGVCVVPMGATLFWKKMSSFAFIAGTTLSTGTAIAVWVGYAKHQSGVVSLAALSTNEASAAGNTIAVMLPVLLVPILVYIKPANFDWEIWKTIQQADDSEFDKEHGLTTVLSGEQATEAVLEETAKEEKWLMKQRNIGTGVSVFFVLFFLVIFPMSLYGSKYVFSKKFFVGWIVVMFIWGFLSTTTILLLPIWEGRVAIFRIVTSLFTGGKSEKGKVHMVKDVSEDGSADEYEIKSPEKVVVNSV